MEVKIFIEIPEGSFIKYELDEKSKELTVDRLMPTAMGFPVNYGLIQNTLGEDGDALDAIIFISKPVAPGVIITCNVIGLLQMEDEAGVDHKIVAVPSEKVDPVCGLWKSLTDVPEAKKRAIKHFFEHYKDLEKEKWVKVNQWQDEKTAVAVVEKAIKRHQK